MATRRLTIALLAAALLGGACGRGGADPLEIGVKRIALDLAFKDETKATPEPPARILEELGLPPDLEPITATPARRPTVTKPPVNPCPVAPDDAFPKEPVTIFFRGAPKAGRYNVHATGTIKVTTAAFPLTLPFPPHLTYEVKNVVVTPTIPPDVPNPPRDLVDQGDVVTYDLVKTISPTLTITDSYHYTRKEFTLTKRVIVNNGDTATFAPTPAITLESMTKGNGDTWSSAGADSASSTAMVVQGAIEKREFVDICGTRYDAWKVNSTETFANLDSGDQSNTDAQQPTVYRFANHLGGLIIQEEPHFTQATTINGAPATVEWDYVATFDSVDPVP
jgi:hypothetical protein